MGAIFEVYDARTGNLVDRIQSNERGMAVSKPLPLGRYYAQEVQAPAFYKINPQPIHFDIEFDTQIVRAVFPNFSANVGVNITKTGPREVMQGHNINYDVRNVRNESTILLSDFFWRDILPTNAVRADKLVTGTYNVQLRYKVMGKTNKGNEIVIADNLVTTRNNVVELKPAHLGLASDEWLIEFSLHFGQVPAGFTMVETAKVFVDVLPRGMANLPNGMMFVNKVDAGGKIPGSNEWAINNATSASTVYNPNTSNRIPQSGW